jgi:Retrotransposon gag protein/Zinc knuckle
MEEYNRVIQELQAQVQLLMQQQQPAIPAPQPALQPIARPPKPEFFVGTGKGPDVDRWLFQMEEYLTLTQANEETWVNLAASYLRGTAADWWMSRAQSAARRPDWTEFRQEIRLQFLPLNTVKAARDKIASLQQITSVQDYVNRFRPLAMKIPNFSEEEKVDRFVRGLKPHIRTKIELEQTDHDFTFDQLVVKAQRIDAILFRNRDWNSTRKFVPIDSSRQERSSEGPTPMELGSITKSPSKLDEETRAKLRMQGVCYYCKEKGHIAVNCPKKNLNREQQ